MTLSNIDVVLTAAHRKLFLTTMPTVTASDREAYWRVQALEKQRRDLVQAAAGK